MLYRAELLPDDFQRQKRETTRLPALRQRADRPAPDRELAPSTKGHPIGRPFAMCSWNEGYFFLLFFDFFADFFAGFLAAFFLAMCHSSVVSGPGQLR